MAYLGRKQLGQELIVTIVTTDGVPGEPSWPDSPPTIDVWSGSTVLAVRNVKMPMADPSVVGLFRVLVLLDDRFQAPNHCEAVVRWTVGSYEGVRHFRFDLVEGGHKDGHVIAMIHHEMPHARYIVYQTDAGLLLRGKNPSV